VKKPYRPQGKPRGRIGETTQSSQTGLLFGSRGIEL
jgi:hypothetical protein